MTTFAARVYKVVSAIPLGTVRSYQWVAKKCGFPRACRAVGTVLKNNPYPLVIPCHRVVRSDKKIGGYVFGNRKKKMILDLEKEILIMALKR
ncbi:MAG: MGMT family protein [Candidatus Omnitrophota bacterium]|nr:MGMT family protein [Candidatus Omnitrophota bacterium]